MGGMGGMGDYEEERLENCVIEREFSLEDIYNERTVKINYSVKCFCKKCNGTGDETKKLEICKNCDGKGKVVNVRQMGPMIQQFVTVCDACKGTGKKIKKLCQQCNGKTFLMKNKEIDLPLKNGLDNGNKLQMVDKGHHFVKGKTDLIVIVKQKEHHFYKREGNNLIINLDIPLYQSLFGVNQVITHLDGRQLYIDHNQLVKDNSVMKIKNEGMKILNSSGKGDLIINFKIKYPNLKLLESNEKYIIKIINKVKYGRF